MTNPAWLPEIIEYGAFDGEWDKFLSAVYEVFERDFKRSRPVFNGQPVAHDSRMEGGREASFWHITSRDDPRTGAREPDVRRCERIPWPKPLIENATWPSASVWRNERKKPNEKKQTRVLIWLEELDYIVVLAEKRWGMVLVTAYCTDIESHREKLRKERDEYRRKQKPPLGAT